MFDMAQYAGAERRRSPRVSSDIKARICAKDITGDVTVLDVSFHGALIKTSSLIEIGETLSLAMHIPTGPVLLDFTGCVVRVVTVCSALGFRSFNVGVEFLNILQDQKQKLSETIFYLFKKAGHQGG